MDVNMITTMKGRILKAKTETGVTLDITRIIAGAGRSDDLDNLESLVDYRQELTITGKYQRGTQAIYFAVLSNKGLKEGYDLTQIAVCANDPEDGEILYKAAQLERAFPISAEKDFPNFAIDCTFTDTISNASQVIVTVDPAGMVTASQFEVIQALAQEALAVGYDAQTTAQDALTTLQENSNNTIISATQPDKQRIGGLWLDTSDGPSDVGEGIVVVANAVVSDTEPQNKPDLWFNT